jgi:hypothetical protein
LGLEGPALEALAPSARAQAIYARFLDLVPYENLSNNRAVQASPADPERWPRATDRLLRENKRYGFGGTSFSLGYALRDLMRGVGLQAHCTLGYNLVTEQAHAAVVLYVDEGPLLFDPALLMCGAIPVRPGGTLEDPLGRFRLLPRCGPTLTVTLDAPCAAKGPAPVGWGPERGDDASRPIYSIIPIPAPPQAFRQAWQASFYRGRPLPLRIARRHGDEIHRYGERPGSLEVLRVGGREVLPVGKDRAETLHRVFGLDVACLREWFARGRV